MKLNKKYLIIITIVLLVVCLSVVGVTFAKYISSRDIDDDIVSDKFYFTVDVLGNTVEDSTLSKKFEFYGGDTKTLSFKVQNYFDDYRITEGNTEYKVEFETSNGYSKVSLNKTTGSFTGGNKTADTITLTVQEGYTNGTEVKVIVSSVTPYTKKMTLTFVLYTYDAAIKYYINDAVNKTYAELIITSNIEVPVNKLLVDYSAINSISNILQVDLTNYYLLDQGGSLTTTTNDALNSEFDFYKKVTNTVKIIAGEAIVIRFFKSDITKNYSVSETNVVQDGEKFTITLK